MRHGWEKIVALSALALAAAAPRPAYAQTVALQPGADLTGTPGSTVSFNAVVTNNTGTAFNILGALLSNDGEAFQLVVHFPSAPPQTVAAGGVVTVTNAIQIDVRATASAGQKAFGNYFLVTRGPDPASPENSTKAAYSVTVVNPADVPSVPEPATSALLWPELALLPLFGFRRMLCRKRVRRGPSPDSI